MQPLCKRMAQAHPVDRLIRPKEMRERLNISRSTLYRWVKSKKFPMPIRVNNKTIGWRERDYLNWLNN